MSTKRTRDESFSDEDEAPVITTQSKRHRGETSSSTTPTPSVLQKLLDIQTRQGGPRLGGQLHEGQSTIELDNGKEIRNRHEWVRQDGIRMHDEEVADDGPNEPYIPRNREVFMQMVESVEKDDLQPLLKAIAGAIDEELDALYDDKAMANRQRHSDIMDEWNKNEMRQLMTNVSNKKAEIDNIRDMLYRKMKIMDGHVQMNASLKAFRDLSNVMFPNAEREQDFQAVYANQNAALRKGSYPLIRVLSEQRQFVNYLCNIVLDGREDTTPATKDKHTINLDAVFLDLKIPSSFRAWFISPRHEKIIDNRILLTAFTQCQDASNAYKPETGISLPNLVRWIRYLDWYIWLRDEMLIELPQVKTDFHDPNATLKATSVAGLLDDTLTASIYDYVMGVTLMKKIQFDTHDHYFPDGDITVNQYASVLAKINANSDRHEWSVFFDSVLRNHFMDGDAYDEFIQTFTNSIEMTSLPRRQPYSWVQEDITWEHLQNWRKLSLSALERFIIYVDLNGIDRNRIINAMSAVVKLKLRALDDKVFGGNVKETIIDRLSMSNVQWRLDDKTLTIPRFPLADIVWNITDDDLVQYVQQLEYFWQKCQGYIGNFKLDARNDDSDDMEDAFDILTEQSTLLAGIDVISVLWPDELRRNSSLPIRHMGGYYASGIHAPDDPNFRLAYNHQHMPTDILIAVTNAIIPNLLEPLAFALTDTLVQQDVITLSLDVSWDILRKDYMDMVFPLGVDQNGVEFVEIHYQASPAIFNVHRVLSTITNTFTVDSFPNTIGPTLGLVQENFRKFVSNPLLSNVITQGHNWILPAVIFAAYMSQRTFQEQKEIQQEYNQLVESLKTMEDEYQRMARGDRSKDLAKNKKYIRDVVHEPDPAYLMLPMFTGKISLKPPVVHVMNMAMHDVKLYCPNLRNMTLNDLAHTPFESFLITRFAEYIAAVYSLKQLIWPKRYKKDKEFKVNPIVRANAMMPLHLYHWESDGTLWHDVFSTRWPRKHDPTKPRPGVGGRQPLSLTI
jgi:hypothetical protein